MSDGQIQTTDQPTVAFVLSLLAGLWMLGAGSMMGGFGWGWHEGRLARRHGRHDGRLDVGAGYGNFWSAMALV